MPTKRFVQIVLSTILSIIVGLFAHTLSPTDTCTREALDAVLDGGHLVLQDDCVLMVSPAVIITGEVIIEGGMLHSNGVDRILIIAEGATLTVRNTQILSGSVEIEPAYGGAILNYGDLILQSVKISANSAERGGGIYNAITGRLMIVDSELARNRAREGGAIYNLGAMVISNSIIDDNSVRHDAIYGGYGAGIVNKGSAVIVNSQIINNQGNGEGIGIDTSGALLMRDSIIMGNQCLSDDCRGTGVLRFDGTINIQQNYWGSPDGPSEDGGGSGDGIINIEPYQFQPFLTEFPAWYQG
ncbi:MAG: right-handed parallel beta-helix repeat-containing protein [Chloroflexota bacterium]